MWMVLTDEIGTKDPQVTQLEGRRYLVRTDIALSPKQGFQVGLLGVPQKLSNEQLDSGLSNEKLDSGQETYSRTRGQSITQM
jgi:hypothetical protein